MTPLTTKQVRGIVADIDRMGRHDDEGAHAAEDELYRDVLITIRDQSTDANAVAIATAALTTQDMGFSRWYA